MKTFMNALTASDWNMYPFATQSDVDYFNLLDVYMDASLFPLLSLDSFKQEGHRLEFEDPENPESPLTIQGIVYNEMKGAMSTQSHIMHRSVGDALFPTITYRFNSGGDPEVIAYHSSQQATSGRVDGVAIDTELPVPDVQHFDKHVRIGCDFSADLNLFAVVDFFKDHF